MEQKIIRVESNGLPNSLLKKTDDMLLHMNRIGFKLIFMSTIQPEKKVDGYGKNEQREMIFERP